MLRYRGLNLLHIQYSESYACNNLTFFSKYHFRMIHQTHYWRSHQSRILSCCLNQAFQFISLFYPGTQLVLSPLPVYFIESASWNTYCNTSSYARLSGDDASVSLSASYPSTVEHRLYGSCLLSMANADKDSSLHVTFTKYPALHE